MSAIVRDILENHLRADNPETKELSAIAGIGEDPTATGRAHDRWIYSTPRT